MIMEVGLEAWWLVMERQQFGSEGTVEWSEETGRP
jgi:hypothetical protein